MKKLLSVLLAGALLFSLGTAAADKATIPLYVSDLDIAGLEQVPQLATEYDASAQTTTVWVDMAIDGCNVNADKVMVPLEFADGTVTYSTRDLKYAVGVSSGGGETHIPTQALSYWKSVGKVDDETAAIRQIVAEYASKGYSSSDLEVVRCREVVSDVYSFYVDADGTRTYVGFYDYDAGASEEDNLENAQNVIDYLVEAENYDPDALSYERETVYEDTDTFQVYLKGQETFVRYWMPGDDAYYVRVGSQTSVHGRDGTCHLVYAWTEQDLFCTDMKCTGTTVAWAVNGNTGAWYPAEVSANYENAFTTNITAEYSSNAAQSLLGYTVTYNESDVFYTVDYNAYGIMEVAKAVDLNGTEFKSTGSSSSMDWVNTATSKFMRSFSLLPLNELKVTLK